VQSAIPSIEQLISNGHSASASVFAVLVGPVRYFILDFVWRFLTDPIIHACWSGLTGYFIGLAATGRYKWYQVAWIGLIVAAILHGLNDWSRVNGHPLWILVSLVSGILFLGYAKVGSRGDPHASDPWPPAFRPYGIPDGHATAAGQVPAAPAGRHAAPAGPPAPGVPAGGRPARPWWEH